MNQLVGLEALRARVPAALRRATDQLNRLLDQLTEEREGRRVRSPATGATTVWPDVASAVAFALELQERILDAEWPTTLLLRPEAAEVRAPDGTLLSRGPRVRCGIHVGVAERSELPDGVVVGGPAVYQLARIVATLHGGQVVVSDAAWAQLGGVPEGAVYTALGEHRLIGSRGYTELHQLLPERIAAREFPPPGTLDIARTNAPPVRPGFLGRDGDLQALAELAGFGVRVITVTGPPGVGKSEVLARFVSMNGDTYTQEGGGGAWLSRIEGPQMAHIIGAAASTFGLSLRFGRTVDELLRQVGAVLASRGPTLLALDAVHANRDELATALTAWMSAAPQLRLLVAAGGRLGLPGEITYELAPLRQAATDGARNEDAVRLFIDKAMVRSPRFQPSEPWLIAPIVNLLGGSPLSISLAAALVAEMNLERLLTEVEGLDGSPESVVDLVWSTLDDTDRMVLSSCAVYPAGFDRLGAEAVVDTESTGIDALEALARLRRAGVIQRTDDPRTPHVRRYRVDARVRRRALAELDPQTRRELERLAAYRVLRLCEGWAELAWGPHGSEVLSRLAIEWVNLAGIAARSTDPGAEPVDVDLALRAVAALWPLVATQGPAGLFVDLASDVLERADQVLGADPVIQGRAIAARAAARRYIGDTSGALADAERGAEVARRWSDSKGAGLNQMVAGLIHLQKGRYPQADEWLARALESLNEAAEPGHAAVVRGTRGVVLMDLGHIDEAEVEIRAALDELTRLRWTRHEGVVMTSLGLLCRRRGQLGEARELYARAAALHRKIGDRRSLAICLVNKASLELRDDQHDAAMDTLTRALAAAQETGDRVAEARVHGNLALAAMAEVDLPVAREHLLAAMAIDRELRDRVGEAVDRAYLGVTLHLNGQLTEACEHYTRALRILDDRAPARTRGHIHAWRGLALAEQGLGEEARAAFQRARELTEVAAEPTLIRTAAVLASGLALLDDRTEPLARAVAAAADDPDVDVQIAMRRVAHLLEERVTGA